MIIVTFGVVTVMLVIPAGIKAQQTSRMSLLASAKAMKLVETFSGRIGGERAAEFETPEPFGNQTVLLFQHPLGYGMSNLA